jgi:hypothetical protein
LGAFLSFVALQKQRRKKSLVVGCASSVCGFAKIEEKKSLVVGCVSSVCSFAKTEEKHSTYICLLTLKQVELEKMKKGENGWLLQQEEDGESPPSAGLDG